MGDAEPNLLLATGEDGVIAAWDLRTNKPGLSLRVPPLPHISAHAPSGG